MEWRTDSIPNESESSIEGDRHPLPTLHAPILSLEHINFNRNYYLFKFRISKEFRSLGAFAAFSRWSLDVSLAVGTVIGWCHQSIV